MTVAYHCNGSALSFGHLFGPELYRALSPRTKSEMGKSTGSYLNVRGERPFRDHCLWALPWAHSRQEVPMEQPQANIVGLKSVAQLQADERAASKTVSIQLMDMGVELAFMLGYWWKDRKMRVQKEIVKKNIKNEASGRLCRKNRGEKQGMTIVSDIAKLDGA